MAKLYGKLRALSQTYENKPKIGLTKQRWSDTPFIIRGKDEGIPAWHYILVPFNKLNKIKNEEIGETFDCNQFGSIIKYIDDQGYIVSMSGWGIDPPLVIQTWFNQYYDNGTIDENINLNYEKDDIRLCTMQRLIPEQFIGIYRRYNKENKFHYIQLFDNYQTSLAYRSGIRNFDRFICLNGINIEQDTIDQITIRFKSQLDLPVQILVCSPSTYHYYKSNNIDLHSHLPTVQHLKPVFDKSLSNEKENKYLFVVVQLDDNICIVSQSSIFKSANYTNINDICFIEIKQKYQRGKILFKGSINECEDFQINLIRKLNNYIIDVYQSNTDENRIISDKIILCKKSEFEDLPNELILDLFDKMTIDDLYNSFSNLNYRLNNLLLSCNNISLILNENTNSLLIKFYQYKIVHLIIDTSNKYDLKQFSNLNSLIISNRNLDNLIQIQPEIFPNLVNLSFLLKSDFKPPIKLVNDIFSNKFPYIRYVNLGHIDCKYSSKSWLKCPSIKIISIRCDQSILIRDILLSCPNLNHFQIHILYNFHLSVLSSSSSSFIHSLQRFTLWSEEFELTIDLIDSILSSIPNIKHLYLQTISRISFIQLIKYLINRLHYLSRFDCFIKELISINERIENLNNIHQISSCFHRIKSIKETEHFRIFSTE